MIFDNINIEYQNVSNGPESGRVYTIDHISNTLIVKTNPGGTLISTIPLDTIIQTEVLELEYDNYYFYTLRKLISNNGIIINKWSLNATNTLLQKELGGANEIILYNTASKTYNAEAFSVHIYNTVLQNSVLIGSITVTLNSITDISLFDYIYLGPSTANTGKREAFTIIGISGNIITLNRPTVYAYTTNDKVTYRKNIYIYNNAFGLDLNNGSLINIDKQTGGIVYELGSKKWGEVTAASSLNGYLWFIRNSQLYKYKPAGVNIGYNQSILLNNTKSNKKDTIKIFDLIISDTSVQKLQKERIFFNIGTDTFQDEVGANTRYHIDEEFLAANFKSVTIERLDNSLLLGDNKTSNLRATVLDQYNVPIFLRTLTVIDDNLYGFITGGFNTITTNVSGQGITRYESGTPLVSDLVTITIRDSLSQIPFKYSVDQIAYVDNTCGLAQQGDIYSKVPVEQKTLQSDFEVLQIEDISMFTFLNQISSIEFKTLIDQYENINKTYIDQKVDINKITFLEQRDKLVDTTTVNQYIFLLFALPKPFSIKNPIDTNILVRIIGVGAIPLNTNTLIFKVNGVDIADQVIITPFGGGLELFYNPITNFEYGSIVSIYIEIEDTNGPPNIITTSYTFGIIEDYNAPILVEIFPENKSINNKTDTIIYAIVKENETELDFNSIEFFIEGIKVKPDVIGLGDKTYKILYNTKCNYLNNKKIDVSLTVADIVGNRLNVVWEFLTEEGSDVLFINKYPSDCQVFVPIDTLICVTALGQKNGIKIDDSVFNINGTPSTFVIKPKVYRKK